MNEYFNDLPKRTLNRSVAAIMASSSERDKGIADVIVAVAQGDKVEWSYSEATSLLLDLCAEKRALRYWLAEQKIILPF